MPPCPRRGAGRGPPDPGKRTLGKVLTGNGITRCERGTYAHEHQRDLEVDHIVPQAQPSASHEPCGQTADGR